MKFNTDINIPKTWFVNACNKAKVGTYSFLCWLKERFSASNGLTFDKDTMTFELGGEIIKPTEITMSDNASFSFTGSNGLGIFLINDEGDISATLGLLSVSGVNVYEELINIFNESELNLVSNDIQLRAFDNEIYLETFVDGSAYLIRLPNLPEYADEAAADAGGLSTNVLYKTATGEVRIKL